jgi:RNA polymerase sigma factor (sigma-70 family)
MSKPRVVVPDFGKADAELIERCRGGDADAWDALFDKYYPVAARFVFQLSADFNHEDTEEICQETFLAVVRNLASFQGKSSFQTWLLRVAANKALDFRGKSRAEKRGGNVVQFSLDGARESGANRSAIGMSRAGYRAGKRRNFSSHSAKPRSAGGSLPGNHRAALLWRAELRRNRGRAAVESENGQLTLKQVS